ncbi:Smr/MutS family protein [Candidatus Nitrosacidococcus sp. I8]|uniref:Smr/MutS family protein n=1 Tax=Candidatus Nitrosacidococcus sp. I8 TaxID=2942908 RepID=UPI0022279FC8|nr:Smr/MutS family protein [Candidatus Nitrosacidococcus sp. I8]CAH9018131.1 putative DNA endonuclease SmrA [Candidatus Nitrosacidococcus sp. I8]
MKKNDPLSDSDKALFQEAVEGISPLEQNRIFPFKKSLSPIPYQFHQDEMLVFKDMLSDSFQATEIESGEELIYFRPELGKRQLRNLRQGKFSISAELDLHGMNVPTARYELTQFLGNCKKRNIRSIRIVHGKGLGSYHKEPILKNKVNTWLQQRDDVLAFCSARTFDGGTGAVYVLLRRLKPR